MHIGQVILEFQYSMAKTFTTYHRVANQGMPVKMQFGTRIEGQLVWNLDFGALGFICNLVFGHGIFSIALLKLFFYPCLSVLLMCKFFKFY